MFLFLLKSLIVSVLKTSIFALIFPCLGLTFNLVTGKSDTLQLKENGTLFFDHKHKESCLLADVDLSHGKHCWGFRICKCDNCDICIGEFDLSNDGTESKSYI